MAEQPADADVAQLVERNLAKVEVAGSNLVIRSNTHCPEELHCASGLCVWGEGESITIFLL